MGMITLQNDRIYLRMLEPQDLQFLSNVENNPEFWTISQTTQPFTNYTLSQYIEQAHQDIYESKQQRWVICQQQTSTIDRKSTRLNSSHVKISYAVFCLKK